MNANPANKKIVIILGAGSTYADADNVPEYEKPPLNNKFFANTQSSLKQSSSDSKERERLLENIKIYFLREHSIDIFSIDDDSLEKVMSKIFLDVKEPASRKGSYPVFRDLLILLHERIGETTNNMTINNTKSLYRLVKFYIHSGTIPENLTIISFNYDIYIEKTLAALPCLNPDQIFFLLQHCYELHLNISDFTLPRRPRQGYFPYLDMRKGGIRVLKLHGSLNWYSCYPNEDFDMDDMLNPDRPVKVSGEKEINSTKLKYRTRDGQIKYTLPVIVPPVPNKKEIYHSKILDLWDYAREELINADEILIFGYSCPPSDTDSQDLLKESLKSNKKTPRISVIDTNPAIFDHYRELIKINNIYWYRDANSFLEEKDG